MTGQATQHRFALRMERTVRAKRDRVFRALVDPDDLARWSAPEGMDVAEGSVDLRVGGEWHVVMRHPETGQQYHARGVYREIQAPERLVYTHWWQTDEEPVETLITVELTEQGEATRVVFVHEGFLTEASRDGHEEGWASCFNRLEAIFD